MLKDLKILYVGGNIHVNIQEGFVFFLSFGVGVVALLHNQQLPVVSIATLADSKETEKKERLMRLNQYVSLDPPTPRAPPHPHHPEDKSSISTSITGGPHQCQCLGPHG